MRLTLVHELNNRKADATACRAADRKQFDSLTNRLREATKCNQSFRNDFDSRLGQLQSCCNQVRYVYLARQDDHPLTIDSCCAQA